MYPNVILVVLLSNILISSSKLAHISTPGHLQGLNLFVKKYSYPSAISVLILDYETEFDPDVHRPCLMTNYANVNDFLKKLVNKPHIYIIFVSAIEKLTKMLSENSKKLSRIATYYVVLSKGMIANDVADIFWTIKLPFTFIISANEGDTSTGISILDIQDCGSTATAKYVADLKDNDFRNISQWNMKTELNGCPIYVAWSIMPPFVNDLNTTMDGIFIEVVNSLNYISKRKIVYRPYDQVYLDEISESYNYASLIEDFENDYAQIFVGPVNLQTSTVFDVSPILTENSLLFLVPRPVNSFWQSVKTMEIGRIFAIEILLQTTVVITFYYMARYTVDRFIFYSINETYVLFAGYFMNIPTLCKLPKTGHLRMYLAVFLLQSMIVSFYIQGCIVSFLSGSLYGLPINTIEKLLETNLEVKLVLGVSFLFRLGRDNNELRVFHRTELLEDAASPFQAGNIAIASRNVATVVDTGYIIMRPNILKSFSVFEVLNIKEVLAMPLNAYFVPQFNEWISRIIEIGVVSKFTKLYKHYYAHKYFVHENKREFTVTFDNILPVLILAGVGYFIAFVCLILELLVFKYKQVLRPKKIGLFESAETTSGDRNSALNVTGTRI